MLFMYYCISIGIRNEGLASCIELGDGLAADRSSECLIGICERMRVEEAEETKPQDISGREVVPLQS